MRHGLMYQGSFEQNHARLQRGLTSFVGTDGAERPIPAFPDEVDGLRVGYLEKAGKNFVATRLQFEDHDVILGTPVMLDQNRHLGGKRFSPQATVVDDDTAEALLDDAIRENPDQREELARLINRMNQVRRGS